MNKRRVIKSLTAKAIGAIVQLGMVNYFIYINELSELGEYAYHFSWIMILVQFMKPGLENIVLAASEEGARKNNYTILRSVLKRYFYKYSGLVLVVSLFINKIFSVVPYADLVFYFIASFLISIIHLFAELHKVKGEVLWFNLMKGLGINLLLLAYFVFEGQFSEIDVKPSDFVIASLIIFFVVAFKNRDYWFSCSAEILENPGRNSKVSDFVIAGLVIGICTSGYPIILDKFIDKSQLGLVFAVQKYSTVLTLISSAIYVAATKELIAVKLDGIKLKLLVNKYYCSVLILSSMYLSLGLLYLSMLQNNTDIKHFIFSGGWLVFLPEIIIMLTGPSLHVINILNRSDIMKNISLFQSCILLLMGVMVLLMNIFEIKIKVYYLYSLILMPIVLGQIYSGVRMMIMLRNY